MTRANLAQLLRFAVVGGSGYVVNLIVFAIATALGAHHLMAAVAAFLVAVSNNFVLNRRWTFRARAGDRRAQALRFFAVSTAAFAVSAWILDVLVNAGMLAIAAEACAIVAVTPLSFTLNKVWCFGRFRVRPVRRAARVLSIGRAS